ncbi:MAG: polysaccharide biosynthesis C-terminal domain-containing protein, partial [Oscillospiraceae bacterium]|nr:polysaccharide biosynthesis C-terminal domain-containing protein [Oscillospiraceae bacterium]
VTAAYMWRKHRQTARVLQETDAGNTASSYGSTMKKLLLIAIPITIGAAGLQIISVIDTKIVLGRLLNACLFSQATADNLKGIYAACQTIFNLPSSFIIPLTVSIIPSITAHLTMQNQTGALQVEESGIRVMSLLALPCGVGLAVMAGPILQTLYNYSGDDLAVGTPLLAILGICVIFNCIVLLTNAIMQAHGHVQTPVVNMLIGGVVKIVVNYILVGQVVINITGAPIGTLTCYITITILNVISMRRILTRKPRLVTTMIKPIIATAIMGVAAFCSYDALMLFLPSQRLSCLAAIAFAAVVYFVAVVALKIITLEDCMLLPKGDKIAKILKIH